VTLDDIEIVVFDFDGTLVDSARLKKEGFFKILSDTAITTSDLEELLSGDSADTREVIIRKALVRAGIYDKESARKLTARYSKHCKTRVMHAPEIPGATELLKFLKANGKIIYISSATPQVELRVIVRFRGLFDFVSEAFGAPEIKELHIKHILNCETVDPSQLLVIGDSQIDRRAALFHNCHFVGIGSSFSGFDCVRFENLRELQNSLG
jgi:phosphoglycolate phosphatase